MNNYFKDVKIKKGILGFEYFDFDKNIKEECKHGACCEADCLICQDEQAISKAQEVIKNG